jgi:hypothetical protein
MYRSQPSSEEIKNQQEDDEGLFQKPLCSRKKGEKWILFPKKKWCFDGKPLPRIREVVNPLNVPESPHRYPVSYPPVESLPKKTCVLQKSLFQKMIMNR